MSADPSLPIPREHLRELLSGWSGEGTLLSALAAVRSEDDDFQWSKEDVERRAHRVLLEHIRPRLFAWPVRVRDWERALPVVTNSRKVTSDRPLRPTNWALTARRSHGWPPQSFYGVSRMTQADELLVNLMSWTVHRVTETARLAKQVSSDVTRGLERQLQAAANVAAALPPDPPSPSEMDVNAASREGHPWNLLAPVSREYLGLHNRLDEFALKLIEPDAEVRWRLFHIAVLGELLAALRSRGARLRWVAPLTASSERAQYLAELPDGKLLEVWFEATGAWRAHDAVPPYPEARQALISGARTLGPDLLLFDADERRALILECKYGKAPYVGRNGYLQAVAYAAEARSDLADTIWSYVVGPEGQVRGESHTTRHSDYLAERVGFVEPAAVDSLVGAFVGR